MICGAWGGRPDKDGIEAITNPSQNPVEHAGRDHGGAASGAHRAICAGARQLRRRPLAPGGLGISRSYRLLAEQAVLQLRSDRMRFRPYGLAGGAPAAPTENLLNPDRNAQQLASKVTMTVARGDLVLHKQPGGGGFGDPLGARSGAGRA